MVSFNTTTRKMTKMSQWAKMSWWMYSA